MTGSPNRTMKIRLPKQWRDWCRRAKAREYDRARAKWEDKP